MAPHRSSREQGFTLIELLMAITISGIITGALALGFITTMRGTASAHERFVASNGAHTLATYFTSDVQSAQPTPDINPGTGTGCATNHPASTTNVLRLHWSEWVTTTELKAFSVSYRTLHLANDLADPDDDEWRLVRYACSGSDDTGMTATAILSGQDLTSSVMAWDIYDPTATAPAYPTAATVAGRKVSLTVYSAIASGETEPFTYSVSASMRTPNLVPSVLSISRVGPTPTNDGTVSWTVLFSDPVMNVDAADFSLSTTGGITGATISGTPSGSGTTYTVTANTGTGNGALALDLVDDDTITDTDGHELGGTGGGNGNYNGEAYTIDKTAPTVTVNQKTGQIDPATSLPIIFEVKFSETVVGLDPSALTLTTPGGGTATVIGSGTDYEVQVTGVTGDGNVNVAIPASATIDFAGNGNLASTSTDNTVAFTAPPMVQSIVLADPDPTSATSLRWTVTFNKNVIGVNSGDFVLAPTEDVAGASLTGEPTGGPRIYTVTANRGTGPGTLGLNLVDNGSITGSGVPLAGATGDDGFFAGQAYTISIGGMIQSVELKNGGSNQGQLEQNDEVIVTFSEAMNPNSFCSSWSSTGNQTLSGTGSGNTSIVVTVENNTGTSGNDVLKVSVGKCTFNFGSIDLGSAGFATGTGNAVFGTSGSNYSAITWTNASNELRIKLGRLVDGGGTVGDVDTDVVPNYTASPLIRNAATPSAPIDNSPFDLPLGRHF